MAVLYTIRGVTRKRDSSTRIRQRIKLLRHEMRGLGFNSFQLISFQWKAFWKTQLSNYSFVRCVSGMSLLLAESILIFPLYLMNFSMTFLSSEKTNA